MGTVEREWEKSMKHIYQVWCTLEIGQEYTVFSSKRKARAFAKEALKYVMDDYPDRYPNVKAFEQNGLLTYKKMPVD
jgi:hypothetical protein